LELQGSEQSRKNWFAGLERLKAKHNLIGDARSKGLLRDFLLDGLNQAFSAA